jgi:hypothetical protein
MMTYFSKGMFDTAPYGKTQKLRSPYASKPYENRPLVIEKGTFAMSCVSAFIPEEAKLIVREVRQKPIRDNTASVCVADEKDKRIFYRHIETGLLTQHAIQYNDWILIGWAIKNAFDDFQMWDDFSKLGGKSYDKIGVRDAWDNMERRDDGVGIGTINHYARKTDEKKANNNIQMETKEQDKEDLQNARHEIIASLETPDETDNESDASEYVPQTKKTYEELYAEQQLKIQVAYIKSADAKKFVLTIIVNDYDFAMLFLKVFGGRFITSKDVSYYYTGYVWKTCDKKRTDLHKFLAREFYMFVGKMYAYWVKQAHDELAKTTDEETQKKLQTDIKVISTNCAAMYSRLTGHKIRQTLVDEIVIYSTDNDIEFNKEHHLFAFKNAIFDLRKNEVIEPNPMYYITLCAGYEYDFNYPKERVEELTRLIETIHQNREIREYYLSIVSTALTGLHPQYFFVFTGAGSNGKGSTNKLLMKTIGDDEGCYGYTAEGTLLTESIKGGSGSPNQAIANMNQKRLIIAQEPKNGGKLQMDTIKRITGENQLNARGLYSTNTKTELHNTLILEANTIPKMDEVSDAVIRRLRIIPFLTKAMDKNDYEMEEDKTNKCVKNTWYDDDKFRDLHKQAFFEILRPYCKAFFERGDIPEQPEICKRASNAHLAISDDMNAWILDNYEQCPHATPITLKNIYEHFKGTEAYLSLTKNAKREFNMATFTNKLASSPFIAKFIKQRRSYYNGQRLNADSLVGWKLKTEDASPVCEDEEYEMADV